MTINENPSGLPEQEPTSTTAVVLLNGEAWLRTGIDQWESLFDADSWASLRVEAAEKGGATLFDIADLPAGLTGVQKGAVRGAAECFNCAKCHALRDAFPKVFADDLEVAEWKPGDPDEKLTDLLRVAEMNGAHTVAKHREVAFSGPVEVRRDTYDDPYLAFGGAGYRHSVWPFHPGWTITATVPKIAVEPGADIPDEAVAAAMGVLYDVGDGELPTNEAMRAALAAADAKRAELEGQA